MVFAKAKSLIQTGTCFVGRLELRSRDAQFASNKSPGRQDIGGEGWGGERADCSLKTSRREIAGAEQLNVLLRGKLLRCGVAQLECSDSKSVTPGNDAVHTLLVCSAGNSQ